MVTAIILINTDRARTVQVGEALSDLPGISEVYSVAGRYDLVAMVRVAHNDDLANLVTRALPGIEGIRATETMISFRAYSRHDLESLFSIGIG